MPADKIYIYPLCYIECYIEAGWEAQIIFVVLRNACRQNYIYPLCYIECYIEAGWEAQLYL